MQNKGMLGSIVAGIIAIFLVLICLFYLSFTLVSNNYEGKAEQYALETYGPDSIDTKSFSDAKANFLKNNQEKKVWLGYTLSEVQRWGVGLGLDLKGGMSVIVQVSMPDMVKSLKSSEPDKDFERAVVYADSISGNDKSRFVDEFVAAYSDVRPGRWNKVFTSYKGASANNDEVKTYIREQVKDMVNTSAAHVLRNRIDAYGVVSPNIQVLQGKDGQILLELPGVKDPKQVINLIEKSANLEFYKTYRDKFESLIAKGLNDYNNDLRAQGETLLGLSYASQPIYENNQYTGKNRIVKGISMNNPVVGYFAADDVDKVNELLVNNKKAQQYLPQGVALLWSHFPEVDNETKYYALYALKTENGAAAMDGSYIEDANADYDQQSHGNVVDMAMNSEGARKWATLTEAEVGFPVAIALDGEIYSAPNVNQKITGGRSQISGSFSIQDAKELANVLKSGKMTARVEVVNKMVIGPSLGQASIDAGIMSFIVALVLLMILMIAYYGFIPGVVANLGLIFNLFFTFGILSSFQAVLTLSGIAGIVLSLGMAVDANVLIYERAREELRAGKNARTAIQDGYSNAFSAIFDANLTSIITGVILLMYGTGPIKGFATTLIVGIICSFFTAVFLTRIVFTACGKKKAFERLTFDTKLSRKCFVNSNFNFLKQSKKSLIICVLLIVAVTASFFGRGLNQGIDFSGGRNYVVKFDQKVNTEDIQKALEPKFPGASVSVITIENDNQVRVSTNYKIDDPNDQAVDEEIQEAMYDVFTDAENGFYAEKISFEDFSTTNENVGIGSTNKVGPTIADEMRKDAIIAVALALIAMFLYILIRFRNVAFSLGALSAVAFTAFTIIGFYSFFYGVLPFTLEIDQTFIAAILTVIGYQINDTVVVFDRVRENTGLYPKKSFYDTINMSINQTLGRTIMTSGSTLLVLLSIFFLGGDSLRSFVFAMIGGVIIGTLATIFIAAPVAYLADSRRKSKTAVKA